MSDKIKTLSQAIRLGSTFRPQGFDCFFQGGRTCAIGAAAEALYGEDGLDSVADKLDDIKARFQVNQDLLHQVYNRNDAHGQTREQIADWLQTQGL